MHTHTNKFIIKCVYLDSFHLICLINFSRQCLILYHIKYINELIMFLDPDTIDNIHRLPCPNDCGHSYTGTYRKKNLKRHLMFECGVEPQFQCPICQKRFSHKSNLKKHVVLVHNLFT